MNGKTILWDMDGVLMNSEPQHYRAWLRTLKELYDIPGIDWDVYKACIGCRVDVVGQIVRDNFGIDIMTPETGACYLKNKIAVEQEEGFQLTEGLKEVLEILQKEGYRMAVASSSPLADIARFVNETGIAGYFDLLFTGEQVKHSKPAPDTFLEAAKRMDADPSECAVIEDSENGVRAAKAAEMFCVGYRNPGSGDQDLSLADCEIRDMKELLSLLL